MGMATLIDFTSREIISDVATPRRSPGTRAIGRWLVYTAATLWRLSDLLARVSPLRPKRRRRGEAKLGEAELPLLTHPDPDVRLLADLAQRLGDAATVLSPPEPQDDLDPDLDIPF
jgi:hypothetical protein